jgi:multidrug efflux system outer membrane protein
MMRQFKYVAPSGLALLLAACAGFPAKAPPVALPTAAPVTLTGDAGGTWPDPQWWRRYQDLTLDALIEAGIASSPTLATAHARFDSARESVRLAGAASGARVGLAADAERQRLSDNGILSIFPSTQQPGFHWYNEFDLGLQASYTFDWWGRQRGIVEAAIDQAHASQAERSAAASMLASSIADAYFGWQADQSRLALLQERRATIEHERAVFAERVRAELESADGLHRLDGDLAAARRQIAGLEGSARLRVITLAALVGRAPADLPALSPKPLPAVAVSLPDDVRLDLIARRADITASRWRVEAAEKNLDSLRADFYPDISINALANLNSLTTSKLLEYGSRAPSGGVALHLPIFDSGRIKAQYRGGRIAIDAAVSAYDATLVEAARDVATAAATRTRLAAERAERASQVAAAAELQKTAAARVRQGLADLRSELSATDAWLQQRDELLQLDGAALSADISLQRALGGGYEMPAARANTAANSAANPPTNTTSNQQDPP